MAISRQLSKTSKGLLFTLLLMSFFGESCNNSKKQTTEEHLAADTLPDKVNTIKAATLIKNFQSADDQLTGDFYFGGLKSSNKAVYFRLNPNQIQSFFEELKQQKNCGEIR